MSALTFFVINVVVCDSSFTSDIIINRNQVIISIIQYHLTEYVYICYSNILHYSITALL